MLFLCSSGNCKGVNRSLSSVGGTVEAMHSVCSRGAQAAGHLAGGTHHAFFDRGEGFCVFSDIAVAANVALRSYPSIRKILIIDLDVHQGNGNAVLFKGNDSVFTFSMHCAGNYFSKRELSSVDVELPVGTRDQEYLAAVNDWIPRIVRDFKPDLAFYQAGVDILHNDKLGKLRVTRAGAQNRNSIVFDTLKKAGTKTVVTMGGGYALNSSE
jgi:acetoin utilization deacetylase AcuC-like enzyme